MTKQDILNDLDYVKSLAEEGRVALQLGGRIGLLWGVLLCAALLAHWAVLTGHLGLPRSNIGLIWMAFGITGGIGSAILGRGESAKAGASAVNNQIVGTIWIANTVFLLLLGFSLGVAGAFGKIDFKMMDLILPVAFGLYAHTAFIEAKFSRQKWRLIPGAIALLFLPLGIWMIGTPKLYLAAIVGVILTTVIPALIDMRREPARIV